MRETIKNRILLEIKRNYTKLLGIDLNRSSAFLPMCPRSDFYAKCISGQEHRAPASPNNNAEHAPLLGIKSEEMTGV